MLFKLNKINYLVVFLYYSFIFTHFKLKLPFPYTLPLFSFLFFLNIKNILTYKFNKNLFLFLLLFFYSLFSVIYTINKIEAIQRIISLGLLIIFLVTIYRQLSFKYMVFFLKQATIIGGIYISLNLLFFDSLLDYKGELEGFTGNRHNSSILFGLYFVFIFVYNYFITNKVYKSFIYLLLFVDLYLIIMTYGRIGLYIIILFLLLYSLYKFKTLHIFSKVIIITLFITLFVISLTFILENEFIIYIIERGLTGRDNITNGLFQYYNNHIYVFFIGFGTGSLEDIWSIISKNIGIIASVRDANNVICVFIENGFIGLIIFITIFIKYFYIVFKLYKKNFYEVFLISIIPIGLVLNISEANWINFNNFSTIIMYVFILFVYKKFSILKR